MMALPDAVPAPTVALKAAIGLGLVVDAGLVALMIAISGFVFGAQEGMNGEASAVAGWGVTLLVCVASPVLGLVMWRRGRRDLALAMVWLPPLALLVGAVATL